MADLATSFIPSLHKPAALLPIARHRNSLLYMVETFNVTIVVGETGSGKTTQLPQYLEQAGWCEGGKVVAVTQVGMLIRSSLNQIASLLAFVLTSVTAPESSSYNGGSPRRRRNASQAGPGSRLLDPIRRRNLERNTHQVHDRWPLAT